MDISERRRLSGVWQVALREEGGRVTGAAVENVGHEIDDPQDQLIRRGRSTGKQRYRVDPITGHFRPHPKVFEPRRPATAPQARTFDEYLSVNILSSLHAVGLPADWRSNTDEFYGCCLPVQACHSVDCWVTREPILGSDDPEKDNPHHAGIWGLVEMMAADWDAYDKAITVLAKAAYVLPGCIR